MWELDCEESWALKNWCFWTVVLQKTLESPLDSKETQPVHPKGNQSWIFIGRDDAEAETPIICHLMRRTNSFEETLMLGKIERREEKGKIEDEMVGCNHHPMDSLDDSFNDSMTWVWVNSRSWWWTGRPSVLQSMGSQRVGHDWVTELTDWCLLQFFF